MKRSMIFEEITKACPGETVFEMTYKKNDGSIRKACCKRYDSVANAEVKGTGKSSYEKFQDGVYQYFDLNSNAWRSAKVKNIIDVTINGKIEMIED